MPRLAFWVYRLWFRRLISNSRLRTKYQLFKLVCWSLFYNHFVDVFYVADTAMEPLFWFVDHFTRFFGPLFVLSVCLLLASVVVIAYVIGVPYWWHHNPLLLLILLIVGNWLLVNVAFHYYLSATTAPGYLPEHAVIPEAVSICKKCISPKPPRTHHCSICNRCVLKMDHHCPWMNTCIGHFNHRYFFLFCCYTVAGAFFIIIFGFNIFFDHFYKYQKLPSFNETSSRANVACAVNNNDCSVESQDRLTRDPALPWQHETWYHTALTYEALLCLGIFLAMGWLSVWHSRMISHGETSIEAHINRAETIRLKKEGKIYVNPYNFGKQQNWRLFLGLHSGRNWLHVLLPSSHLPEGNGFQWKTVNVVDDGIC